MRLRFGLTLCALLALAACGGGKKETGGTAGGEILPASVSDAMLPHDTVRSQAPLAKSVPEGKAGASTQDADEAEAADVAEEVVETGAPAPAEAADAE